ncbi:substrate-binding periplasmic protein [Pseudoduganella sp. R-34]|uniref:substrate-binding periplasmic protein n=1 Tax=unclassified Pseudoduganella TaxID=2637179 RepID=UPI003CE80212
MYFTRQLLFAFLLASKTVHASDLVMAISNGSGMPMTDIRGEELKGGILKEFGDALGGLLHLEPRYMILPRTRVEGALLRGHADLLCDLRPEWLDNQGFLWSDAIISNRMMVAMRSETPVPASLNAIAGLRVGTIRGYRYPEIEHLQPPILRDNAANDSQNLEKLLLGRFDFIFTNRIYFDYQRKVHPERARLASHNLKITDFDTYCAVHPQGKLGIRDLNQAIATLKARGTIRSILARYRPHDSS